MSYKKSEWITATIASAGTTSSEVNLGKEYRDVQVYSPAIDSATLTIKPSRTASGTATQAYMLSGAATGDYANTTTAKTTAAMNWFLCIGAQYITLVLSAAQTGGARTFYVRGVNPI